MEEYRIAFDTYQISNYGNFRRKLKSGTYKYIDGSLHNGYRRYCLMIEGKSKQVFCHHLVAKAFLGERPPDHTHIDHIDRNRGNNHISNLRWATPRLNMQNKETFKNYTKERQSNQGIRHRVDIRRDGKRYSKTFETKEEAHGCVENETFYDATKNAKAGEGHIHTYCDVKNNTVYRAMKRIQGTLYTKCFRNEIEAKEWIANLNESNLPESERRPIGGGNISTRNIKTNQVRYDAKIKINKQQFRKTFTSLQEAEKWLDTFK